MDRFTEEVVLSSNQIAKNIFGKSDENLNLIERSFPVEIIARGNRVKVMGKEKTVKKVSKLFRELNKIAGKSDSLHSKEVEYAIELAQEGELLLEEIYNDVVQITSSGKRITPKTIGQKKYLDALRRDDIVFGIGPAGTGKTYLAVVMAVNALISNRVERIILTRPAIEAGENLGFLPGDLQEKVDPYLRPLYDSLYDTLGAEKVDRLLEKNIIEIAPLAYMRGRTLQNSAVILDEAQNTTSEQMKMFLTRLGSDSKAVITGDITQVDLPSRKKSGLADAEEVLNGIEGISFTYLTNRDVVRHGLVKEIIKAYESIK